MNTLFAGPIEFNFAEILVVIAIMFSPWIIGLSLAATGIYWFIWRRQRPMPRRRLGRVLFISLLVSFVGSAIVFGYLNVQHNAPGADYQACLGEGKSADYCGSVFSKD